MFFPKFVCMTVAVAASTGTTCAAETAGGRNNVIILPCSVTAPESISVPGSGGHGVITVYQTNLCGPLGTGSDAAWASARFLIKSQINTVEWTVQPNRSSAPRTASLYFSSNQGGDTMLVNQAGSCATSLNQSQATVPYTGRMGSVSVTSVNAGCSWTASSDKRWAQPYPISATETGPVRYTVFPNFSTLQRSVVITIGDKDFTIVQPGNPRTANERIVQLFYFSTLGRLPADDELAWHVSALQSGLSRAQLFDNFYSSQEFQLGGRFVAGAYYGLLKRLPEYGGWLFQRNAVATGQVSGDALIANFLASAEYALLFGSPDASAFVRLLYRNILFRTPTDEEVAFQVAALGDASVTRRAGLARGFLLSQEFRSTTATPFHGFLLPATLIQRDVGDAEKSDIQLRMQLQGLIGAIEYMLGYPEFAEGVN